MPGQPKIAATSAATKTEITSGSPRRISFNQSWRFFKGNAVGAEQPGFNDSGWRALDLPHDWAIEGPFDPKYNPQDGGLPFFGIGWYRKHSNAAGDVRGKHVSSNSTARWPTPACSSTGTNSAAMARLASATADVARREHVSHPKDKALVTHPPACEASLARRWYSALPCSKASIEDFLSSPLANRASCFSQSMA